VEAPGQLPSVPPLKSGPENERKIDEETNTQTTSLRRSSSSSDHSTDAARSPLRSGADRYVTQPCRMRPRRGKAVAAIIGVGELKSCSMIEMRWNKYEVSLATPV